MKKLTLIFLVTLFAGLTFAQIPPVIPNTYVQDHAGVLTPEDEANIQNQLNQLKLKYNLEFGVATVNTTAPKDIASYSIEMARAYGIGTKDGEKRGILLLLAIQDHKWRFEISRHMEGVLTDAQSGSIGRNVLVPAMKKAKDSAGYTNAILLTVGEVEQQIIKNIEPEKKDPPYVQPSTVSGIGLLGLLGSIGLFSVLIGGGYGLYSWRKGKREDAERLRRKNEQEARNKIAREELEQIEKLQRKRAIAFAKEQEEKRIAHEAYLKTPAGKAEIAEIKKAQAEEKRLKAQKARQEKRLEELERQRYLKWSKTPEGKAELARQQKEAKQKVAQAAKRKKEQYEQEQKEEAEREARQRESSYSSSSYGSSYSSGSSYGGSSSSSYDSGSSSSGGFSGGSDFGGGGSDGSW